MSRGSANAHSKLCTQLNAYAKDNDSKLHFGKDLVAAIKKNFDRTRLPIIEEADFDELACINLEKTAEHKKKRKKHIGSLKGSDEQALQDKLQDLCYSVDTHTSLGDAVEFMPPRNFSDDVVAFTNTGKADSTSTVRRMVFEVKSKGCEDDLLLQMLERFTALDMSHLLKNVLVFGATPTEAYVFIGTRSIPESRQEDNVKSLYLFRTTNDLILQYWWRASQCTPLSFLTEDAPFVLHALMQMKIDPWLCRVRLCGWSQSRVYDITLPKRVKWSTGKFDGHKHCIGAVVDAVTFALKVISDNKAFQKEETALQAIRPSFLLGTLSFCDAALIHTVPNKIDIKKRMKSMHTARVNNLLASADENGWWRNIPTCPSTGGVVVMKYGKPLIPDSFSYDMQLQMFNDCFQCLMEMHNKKFCHTDVRLANILQFGDKFGLVDFGEAVRRGSTVNIGDFSEGRRKLVTTSSSLEPLKWKYQHDIAMLARACLDDAHPNFGETGS